MNPTLQALREKGGTLTNEEIVDAVASSLIHNRDATTDFLIFVFNNVYFRPLRILVKTLIPALAAVFIAVLFWQLVLDALLK